MLRRTIYQRTNNINISTPSVNNFARSTHATGWPCRTRRDNEVLPDNAAIQSTGAEQLLDALIRAPVDACVLADIVITVDWFHGHIFMAQVEIIAAAIQ